MERSPEFFSRLIVFGLFTRVNQMAYRMTGSLQRCQYRDVNTEQKNLWDHGSRPGGDAPNSPRNPAGGQTRQTKYTSGKKMFEAGDMDY
jgi:hypothetical protein